MFEHTEAFSSFSVDDIAQDPAGTSLSVIEAGLTPGNAAGRQACAANGGLTGTSRSRAGRDPRR
jgi:hypothetical protein